MKILLVHNHYRPPSGENVVFNNEKLLLQNNGCAVVTYERSNKEIDSFGIIKNLQVAISLSWSQSTYLELSRLIQETRPHIAHFHNTFPLISVSAFKACQDNGVPVVQTLHNYRWICPGAMLVRNGRPCEACIGHNLLPALQHRCYYNNFLATAAICVMLRRKRKLEKTSPLVNRYITLTEFATSRLVKGGIPRNRIVVKPNFLPVTKEKADIRENYAVFAGVLNKEKGLPTLLSAWKGFHDFPLKIVGDGPLRKILEDQALNENLNVEFCGNRSHDDVLRIIRKAALMIIPSELYENFPMTVLEAYASGTPLVASRIGSLAEIVNDGVTGLLFMPGNADDLAAKVQHFRQSESLAHRVSANALAVFREKYTPERNIKMLLAIYEGVINDRLR